MKRETAKWVRKAEEDWLGVQQLVGQDPLLRDLVCFHCQQSAEKYLKALVQDLGIVVPKTHNLRDLFKLLIPHDKTLTPFQRGSWSLTRYAVDFRYPSWRTTTRQMKAAIRKTEQIRREMRRRLGLPV